MLGVSLELNPNLSPDHSCQVLTNLALHRPETILYVNWEKVAQRPTYSLPEAVALSLGINPEYAYLPWVKEFSVLLQKHTEKNSEHWKKFYNALKEAGDKEAIEAEQNIHDTIQQHSKIFSEVSDILSEFISRFHIAENNIKPLGKLEPVENTTQFNLMDFDEWAKKRKWSFPPEYPSKKKGFSETTDKSTTTLERHTMLKIIIGMAIGYYGHDAKAKRSDTVKDIVSDLKKEGISVSDDTVRKYLVEATDLLPEEDKNIPSENQ